MNTNQAKNVMDKIGSKSVELSAVATAALLSSTSAMAGSGSFSDMIDADRQASKSMVGGNGGAAESGLSSIYEFIKWGAVVIGLVLAVSGLLYVSKAAKSEGQKSQMPGWITFGIGGLMTVVGVFMFAVGKTAVSVIGAEET